MSEVYSFRLSDQNPREAQAREVIDAWVKKGYSLRHVLTEALLMLGNQETATMQMDNMVVVVDRLSRLVDRLDVQLEIVPNDQTAMSELSSSFISSIKMVAKPGMRMSDE